MTFRAGLLKNAAPMLAITSTTDSSAAAYSKEDSLHSAVDVPNVLWTVIFSFLQIKDLLQCARVNRRWLAHATDPRITVSLRSSIGLRFTNSTAVAKQLSVVQFLARFGYLYHIRGLLLDFLPDAISAAQIKSLRVLLSQCHILRKLMVFIPVNAFNFVSSSFALLQQLLFAMLQANPHLETFVFRSNIPDVQPTLSELAQHCQSLKVLNLFVDQFSSSAQLVSGLGQLQHFPLTDLQLEVRTKLFQTDDLLQLFSNISFCARLQRLRLGAKNINFSLLISILQHCNQLQSVSIGGALNESGDELVGLTRTQCLQLFATLPSSTLTTFSFTRWCLNCCDSIDCDMLQAVMNQFPHLRLSDFIQFCEHSNIDEYLKKLLFLVQQHPLDDINPQRFELHVRVLELIASSSRFLDNSFMPGVSRWTVTEHSGTTIPKFVRSADVAVQSILSSQFLETLRTRVWHSRGLTDPSDAGAVGLVLVHMLSKSVYDVSMLTDPELIPILKSWIRLQCTVDKDQHAAQYIEILISMLLSERRLIIQVIHDNELLEVLANCRGTKASSAALHVFCVIMEQASLKQRPFVLLERDLLSDVVRSHVPSNELLWKPAPRDNFVAYVCLLLQRSCFSSEVVCNMLRFVLLVVHFKFSVPRTLKCPFTLSKNQPRFGWPAFSGSGRLLRIFKCKRAPNWLPIDWNKTNRLLQMPAF